MLLIIPVMKYFDDIKIFLADMKYFWLFTKEKVTIEAVRVWWNINNDSVMGNKWSLNLLNARCSEDSSSDKMRYPVWEKIYLLNKNEMDIEKHLKVLF